MSNNIALLLFTSAVLLTSFVVVYLPPAIALTQSTWDDSHTTARWGNSKVCGDHLCAPGEHDKWVKALNDAQREYQAGHARNAQHGETVIQQLAQATGNTAMQSGMATQNMTATGNMTGMGNMTTPNGYR